MGFLDLPNDSQIEKSEDVSQTLDDLIEYTDYIGKDLFDLDERVKKLEKMIHGI